MKREIVQRGPEPSPIAAYLSDGVKAGPYVFASGLLVPTEPSSDPYHSAIKVQTERVIQGLAQTLEAGGSSLDQTLRIGLFLSDLDDLPGQSEVRRAHLAKAAPPSTAMECGLVRQTAVIEIEAIGLVPGPGLTREVVATDEVPRPVVPYAQAIKAGPFVFVAGVMATDFASGVAPEARVPEGLPWFSSPIKRQTAWTLETIGKVLAAAGSSLDQVVKAQAILTDIRDFLGFDEVWREFFPSDPPARTVVQAGLVNPGCLVEVDVIAIAPESGLRKEAITTDAAPVPTTAESQAIRAGEWVFTSGLLPTDFATGIAPEARVDPNFPRYGSAIKRQAGFVLRSLQAILEAAGSDMESVVRVGAFHTALQRDLLGSMEVRREFFPEAPPASTTIEVPALAVPGSRFMFDAIAVVPDA